MATTTEVGIEDIAGVKSRVSWGAIFGGGVVALATYLVLTLFFAGVGLSLAEAGVRAGNAAIVSVILGILSIVVAMYVGGCTSCVLTAGETRREAKIYGVLTWALVTFFAIVMVMFGLTGGYLALLGAATTAEKVVDKTNMNWEQVARNQGVTQETIDNIKKGNVDQVADKADANVNEEKVADQAQTTSMIAAWSTLAGTLLSLGAAVLGGIAGVGPTFRVATVVRT